jgi:hypothetical protein
MNEQIYSRFIELTELSKGDRITLQKRRGFTDDTIDEFQFRSGHKDVTEPAMDILKDEFALDKLLESGLLIDDSGQAVINKQLLEGRILIPYPDVDGKTVYRIRPHKLGFKNKGIDIYCRYLLRDKCKFRFKSPHFFRKFRFKNPHLCSFTTKTRSH